MTKEEIVEKLCKSKGNENNTIDLDAYARGLIDMWEYLNPNIMSKTDFKKIIAPTSLLEVSSCQFIRKTLMKNFDDFINTKK